MPTVIVVDVSLSMCRPIVKNPDSTQSSTSSEGLTSRKDLSIAAINQFLDHISTHCKLEFISLLTFSSDFYLITETFTRNVNTIRDLLDNLSYHDTTNYEAALEGISATVIKQWSNTVSVEILLITDGSPSFGPGSLPMAIKHAKPFPFPAKMNIISLNNPSEKNYSENVRMLHQLIEITAGDGEVYLPEDQISIKSISSAVSRLCVKHFTPYKGILRCGKLSSKITLCPPPQPFSQRSDDIEKRQEISEVIDILGFIDLNDLASPAASSRHLLLPIKSVSNPSGGTSDSISIDDENDGNLANFCVLLHGALKIENFCALCEVGPDWYGFLYSWADNKKKSNLMLSILPIGTDVVPWLGNMYELGTKIEQGSNPHQALDLAMTTTGSFPVKPLEKKSYVSNPTVWLGGEEDMHSDIQKLLRHARKIPEKTAQFYKELNRMRKWALVLGFTQMLDTLAQVLERECVITTSTHPELTIQLEHAVQQLKTMRDYSKPISPFVSSRSNPRHLR